MGSELADFNSDDDCCSYYHDDYSGQDGVDRDDDDDDDDSIGVSALEIDLLSVNVRGPTVKVVKRESLLADQREDLHKIMNMLCLKEYHARTLLIHYQWDVQKLVGRLVEHGKDKLFAAAGLKMPEQDESLLFQLPPLVTCNICYEDVSSSNVTTMDCGHYFCNNCWAEHFVVKINQGQSRRIRCMSHNCNIVCNEEAIRKLVGNKDPVLSDKFNRFLLESYIDDNKRVKWCPSVPHCGNAVQVEGDEICEVECVCGVQFCFSCSSEVHSPCSCEIWELWSKKCKDESVTVKWLRAHTKPCPSCRKPVQKNGGCNHVSCVCGQSFCWLCGAATGQEHSYGSIANHSCGRYKEENEKKISLAKQYLERYIHYYNRYKAHLDSLKLESKLKESLQEKINILEEKGTSKDFSWVINGLARLFKARRILSYSYAFAYYMFGDEIFRNETSEKQRKIKQNLFEDQQQQFEVHVEKLSSVLEEKFGAYSEVQVLDMKMRTIALLVTTDNLCRNMYEYIETDLLGSLGWTAHRIAPYMSKGVPKASL